MKSKFFYGFGRMFSLGLSKIKTVLICLCTVAVIASALTPTTMWISNSEHYYIYDDDGVNITDSETETVTRNVDIDIQDMLIPAAFVSFCSPIAVVVAFSFLRKKKDTDFYMSIPYERHAVFGGFFCASAVGILAIEALSLGVCLGLSAVLPGMNITYTNAGISVLSVAANTVFLAAVAALACSLTGNLISTAMAFGGILVFPTALGETLCCLAESDVIPADMLFGGLLKYDSTLPIGLIKGLGSSKLSYIVFGLIVSAVYVLLAGLAFSKRRSETAEDTAINSKILNALQLTVPVLGWMLVICLLKDGIYDDNIALSLLILLVCAVFYSVILLIGGFRKKEFVRMLPKIFYSCIAAAVIACLGLVLHCSSLMIPLKASNIESFKIDSESMRFNSYYVDNDYEFKDAELIENLVDSTNMVAKKNLLGKHISARTYVCVAADIKLNSGRTIRRVAYFRVDESMKFLEYLVSESPDFREKSLSLPSPEEVTVGSFYYYDKENQKNYSEDTIAACLGLINDKMTYAQKKEVILPLRKSIYAMFKEEYDSLSDADKYTVIFGRGEAYDEIRFCLISVDGAKSAYHYFAVTPDMIETKEFFGQFVKPQPSDEIIEYEEK